mgnify:CR=1 FL=1
MPSLGQKNEFIEPTLILENISVDKTTYQIYDIFFGKYLRMF